ncbi:hypothetical protein HanOQP8_Chr00c025g0717491 [Helianthus annuus]|nr:hypothetical protein HanOQP8_Chr00c025g0717491 [Helianthus annuus]
MVHIQPLAHVEEKVLHRLGWKNLEFIKERRLGTYHTSRGSHTSSQTKMYYEFGIFSTIYLVEEIPTWITCRRKGPSISFTIPSTPKKLEGLNFCCVEMSPHCYFALPMIKISNITKNQTWTYDHYIDSVSFGGNCLSLLSHWLFGSNEMKSGDQITIIVEKRTNYGNRFYARQDTKECGISFLYDDGSMEKEEEDTLGYYKSWNHIIGGDLSPFQLTTGEYLLDNSQFTRYTSYIDDEANYKGIFHISK